MSSKTYTAQEMRETSAIISRLHIVDRTTCGEYSARIKDKLRSMLRQAANAMERKKKREKKREKKYEYSVHPADVYGVFQHRSAAELNVNFFKALGVRTHLVRREVGEWEEVKDA